MIHVGCTSNNSKTASEYIIPFIHELFWKLLSERLIYANIRKLSHVDDKKVVVHYIKRQNRNEKTVKENYNNKSMFVGRKN